MTDEPLANAMQALLEASNACLDSIMSREQLYRADDMERFSALANAREHAERVFSEIQELKATKRSTSRKT